MEQHYRRVDNRLPFLAIVAVLFSMESPLSHSLRFRNILNTKSAVFLSPKFVLGPGSVDNKLYYNIDFPTGHIAVKSFDAEVVDESGNPVPLHETYLHHWIVMPYRVRKEVAGTEQHYSTRLNASNFAYVRNEGVCQGNTIRQYFGLGSETRRTPTYVPDPYGIEAGNPTEIREGFVERWMLNVHAIDTRGAVDRLGCTECRCDLYNVTQDEYGRPLRPGYKGGLFCCYDQTQCRVKEGFNGAKRSLYLRYIVQWVDWSESVAPVRIYIFDVTDTWKALEDESESSVEHKCHVEYEVEQSCEACVDTRRNSVRIPSGGHVVYGVAHQHTGGVGSTLYGESGRVICRSNPTYGKGKEAGDESGYIVGMSTCYPEPGSVEIADGETLVHESHYNSSRGHTGVMALFYIMVAV